MNPVLGGISLTRVQVYNQRAAPDSHFGGCPHLHAIAHEAYLVTKGAGWVEFHEPARGMWTEALAPGDVLQFPPGVLHRIVTTDHLEIMALLSHAGIAEAGDARIWFGTAIDADQTAYADVARLPENATLDHALSRRDRAVSGYQELLGWWENDRETYRRELTAFRNRHGEALAARTDLADRLQEAHPAWGAEGLQRLRALPAITASYAPRRWALDRDDPPRLGMCGLLHCSI